MNVDVRRLLADGERAVARGWHAKARAYFREAGHAAAAVQLWRAALRCYRHGLEVDLVDRHVVRAVLALPDHVIGDRGWDAYLGALDAAEWRAFSCRDARVVTGPRGAFVDCPPLGPILDLAVTDDIVEARPIRRFAAMPLPMAMIILRRAYGDTPIRVRYAGRRYVLDELGDWELDDVTAR